MTPQPTQSPTFLQTINPRNSFVYEAVKHPAGLIGIGIGVAVNQIPTVDSTDKFIAATALGLSAAAISLTPSIVKRVISIKHIATKPEHLRTLSKGDSVAKYAQNSLVSAAVAGLAIFSAGIQLAVPEIEVSAVPLVIGGLALVNNLITSKLVSDHIRSVKQG